MASPSNSAPVASNLSCARCHWSEAELERRLLRCTGCRDIQYCSTDCQSKGWPQHKRACRQIRNGTPSELAHAQVSTRSTSRLRGLQFCAVADHLEQDEGEDGTIYHLITSTPHLHDVSASGPYHSIDAVYEQIGANFGDSCRPGTETALEVYNDGAFDSAEHITAAMYGHPNWTKKCRIIGEPNAVVKATLPGEVYVVNSTDFNTELADGAVPGAVRAMHVHGTFADVDSAVERARQIAQQMAEEVEGGSMVKEPREQSGFRRTYCVRSSTRSEVFIVVGVRLDTGVIYHPPTSN